MNILINLSSNLIINYIFLIQKISKNHLNFLFINFNFLKQLVQFFILNNALFSKYH